MSPYIKKSSETSKPLNPQKKKPVYPNQKKGWKLNQHKQWDKTSKKPLNSKFERPQTPTSAEMHYFKPKNLNNPKWIQPRVKNQESKFPTKKPQVHKSAQLTTKIKGKIVFERNKSFYTELVKINAYGGEAYLRNHYSQESLVLAYRNDHSMYNLHSGIFHIKRALHFLKKQNLSSFVFVGAPEESSEKCSMYFQKLDLPFFSSSQWFPGFISKKTCLKAKIVVIYDISTNMDAKSEAFQAKFPTVAFLTMQAEIEGIDFPINLNLENCGMWYYTLWKSFFEKKQKDDTRL